MSTDSFEKHFFKVPKKVHNRIKKEYADAKEAKLAQNASLSQDLEKLKNYTAAAIEIFDFYEELSGRKVNRLVMDAHIHYWLDEGFNVEAMKGHLRSRKSSDWMKENEERFTIANVLPIKDLDRINMTWDLLSYEVAKTEAGKAIKTAIYEGVTILRKECGHRQSLEAYRKGDGCVECADSALACVSEPYSMMPKVSSNELRELCYFFMRKNEESLADYAKRTYQKRAEIYQANHLKFASEKQLISMLKENQI